MVNLATCRAFISCYSKVGLTEIGRRIEKAGLEIVASEGTCEALCRAGVHCSPIEEVTGQEITDRAKTLQSHIHEGIFLPPTDARLHDYLERGIKPITFVYVQMYPIEDAITASEHLPFSDIAAWVDVGGTALIANGIRNFNHVFVATCPDTANLALTALTLDWETSSSTRRHLARIATRRLARFWSHADGAASLGSDSASLQTV